MVYMEDVASKAPNLIRPAHMFSMEGSLFVSFGVIFIQFNTFNSRDGYAMIHSSSLCVDT